METLKGFMALESAVFRRERWYPGAVQARKGTQQAIFQRSLVQGSRRCPGSRVASLEVHMSLARLLLDLGEIKSPSHLHWSEIPSVFQTVVMPELSKSICSFHDSKKICSALDDSRSSESHGNTTQVIHGTPICCGIFTSAHLRVQNLFDSQPFIQDSRFLFRQ